MELRTEHSSGSTQSMQEKGQSTTQRKDTPQTKTELRQVKLRQDTAWGTKFIRGTAQFECFQAGHSAGRTKLRPGYSTGRMEYRQDIMQAGQSSDQDTVQAGCSTDTAKDISARAGVGR
jgi:hypothetical protein